MATALATTNHNLPSSGPSSMKRLDGILAEAWGAPSFSHLPDINSEDADFLESQLSEHLAPDGQLASEQEIGRMIAEMESVLPQRRKSEGEGAMQLGVFRRAVNDIPKRALARACFRATKELGWFPTPSQIIAFANEEGNRRQNRIFIMERLLAKAGRRPWPHEA